MGGHQEKWLSWMWSLHMHGWLGRNLLPHCSHALLAGDCCSYSLWCYLHLKTEHVVTSIYACGLPSTILTMEELQCKISQGKKVISSSSKWEEMVANNTPTQQELMELFTDLAKDVIRKPAIISLTEEYSERFTTASDHPPPLLQSLYEPQYLELNYLQFLKKVENGCREPVSEEQVSHLKEMTRGQSKNRLWFKYRSGHIIASQLHQVCHTNPHQPALSLVRKVCYPEAYNFATAAASYGSTNEAKGITAYKSHMTGHSDLSIKACGLFVDQTAPFLGASPDALVHCTCCGNGVVEVRCQWRARDYASLEKAAEQQIELCLQKLATTVDGYSCQQTIHISCRVNCSYT